MAHDNDYPVVAAKEPELLRRKLGTRRRVVVPVELPAFVSAEGVGLKGFGGVRAMLKMDDSLMGASLRDDDDVPHALGRYDRLEQGEPLLTPPADRFDQAVDFANNTIEFMAQRKASVSWGCCHIGTAIAPIADDLTPGGGES